MNKDLILQDNQKRLQEQNKKTKEYAAKRKEARKQFENTKWQNLNGKQKDDILKEIAITLKIIKE